MKKITILMAVLALGAVSVFTSCNKEEKASAKEVDKIVKWGNRNFTYNESGRILCIAEYDGDNYGKTNFEYDGNKANVYDEQYWPDFGATSPENELKWKFELNNDGYATKMEDLKEGFVFTFKYDKNGYLIEGAAEIEGTPTTLFTRKIEGGNAVSWTQTTRNFEYGEDWSIEPVQNATLFYTFGNDDNVGGLPFEVQLKRHPSLGGYKLERMFFLAGLFGKASAKLPTASVWKKQDGTALPDTYYETTNEYFYKFDSKNRVGGFSTDNKDWQEIIWETMPLK